MRKCGFGNFLFRGWGKAMMFLDLFLNTKHLREVSAFLQTFLLFRCLFSALWFHILCAGDGNENWGQGKTDEGLDERKSYVVVWGFTPCCLPGGPEGGILADRSWSGDGSELWRTICVCNIHEEEKNYPRPAHVFMDTVVWHPGFLITGFFSSLIAEIKRMERNMCDRLYTASHWLGGFIRCTASSSSLGFRLCIWFTSWVFWLCCTAHISRGLSKDNITVLFPLDQSDCEQENRNTLEVPVKTFYP